MPKRVVHATLAKLPQECLAGGALVRTAVRGDHSLITVNPFDQVSFVFQGTLEFDVDCQTYVVTAGEVLLIPADAPHTTRLVGDEVALNVDVYAPVRQDYLYLTAHHADAFGDEQE